MPAQSGPSRLANDRDRDFSDYYRARGASMRATAYLLCADWYLAEDLVQTAFTKLYLIWRRVSQYEALDAYLRQTVFRTFIDYKRRPWRRERATDVTSAVFERAETWDNPVDERLLLVRALDKLPPRQRAVLVLRFWEDLSVCETAEVLGCTSGTVKSQSAKGLRTLRGLLDESSPSRDLALESLR